MLPTTEGSWSLITVTHNSARALSRYWGASPVPDGVDWVVVDNNSSDDSVAVARDLGARVLSLTDNVGFGAANNIGLRATSAPYVAFVNPDVTVDYSSLPTLAAAATAEQLVAPQLVNPDGSAQPNGRGYPFLAYKVLSRLRPDKASDYLRVAPSGVKMTVVWAIGAVIAARREVFHMLGPWDERFFVYYEDSDLGLRASAQAIPTVICGDVNWVHGWARETTTMSVGAWKREIPSLLKFYARYPRLLSPLPRRSLKQMKATAWPAAHLGSIDKESPRRMRSSTSR